MVEIENVTRRFTALSAVRGVSLRVEGGNLVALLGPSGCGKTTLLRMIAGLERCDEGRILINGRDVTRTPVYSREIGFVFQNYALFPHLTVYENVAFGLRVRKKRHAEIRTRVHEMLDLVNLHGFAQRLPAQLSGGQRQRVALARALSVEPAILLLDEPFAALDVHVRKELRSWLRGLHSKTHVTTLIVTHDPEEAMEIADEIALMNDGHIEQFGRPRDLYERPVNVFAMRFLGPVSTFPSSNGEPLHLRPHQFRMQAGAFAGSVPASVLHTTQRGATVQFDLKTSGGHEFGVEIPLSDARALLDATTLHVAPLEYTTATVKTGTAELEIACA